MLKYRNYNLSCMLPCPRHRTCCSTPLIQTILTMSAWFSASARATLPDKLSRPTKHCPCHRNTLPAPDTNNEENIEFLIWITWLIAWAILFSSISKDDIAFTCWLHSWHLSSSLKSFQCKLFHESIFNLRDVTDPEGRCCIVDVSVECIVHRDKVAPVWVDVSLTVTQSLFISQIRADWQQHVNLSH